MNYELFDTLKELVDFGIEITTFISIIDEMEINPCEACPAENSEECIIVYRKGLCMNKSCVLNSQLI